MILARRNVWTSHKALNRAVAEGRTRDVEPIIPGQMPYDQKRAAALFGEDLTAGINALPRSADVYDGWTGVSACSPIGCLLRTAWRSIGTLAKGQDHPTLRWLPWLAAGGRRSLRAIAIELEKAGFVSATGKRYEPTGVARMLGGL